MKIGVWKPSGAYVIGRGHERQNILCQDRTFYKREGPKVAIALADGAGSYEYSHIGAENVTKTIVHKVLERFEFFIEEDKEKVKDVFIYLIKKTLRELSKGLKIEEKELSSTFLFVGVDKKDFIAAHIGDGIIGYLEGRDTKVLSYPENGEFANETYFTTSDLYAHLRIYRGKLEGIEGFILMSDGTAHGLYNKREKKFGKAVNTIFSWPLFYTTKEVDKILYKNLKEVIRKKTIDDCSLSMLRLIVLEPKEFAKQKMIFRKDILGTNRFDTVVHFEKALKYFLRKKAESDKNFMPPFSKKTMKKYKKMLQVLDIDGGVVE